MKRLLLILFTFAVCVTTSQAQTYKIIMLNTPAITIGGKSHKVNETFDGTAAVAWASPRQAMKVLDVDKGTQRLIVAEQFSKSKVQTIREFMSKNNHLSTRDGELDNPVALGTYLSDTFYLVDSLTVNTSIPTDDKRFFYISFDYKGEEINKKIPCSEGSFTVSKEIFTVDGEPLTPFDTPLSVYYLDSEAGKLTLITDSMFICVLPDMISTGNNE